jgi:hypothetical protein
LPGCVVVVVGGIVVADVLGTVVDGVVVEADVVVVVLSETMQLESTVPTIITASRRRDRDTKRQRIAYGAWRMAYHSYRI